MRLSYPSQASNTSAISIDWVILAESRWKLRRAVRLMNQVLAALSLEKHPEKTFIGRAENGFDYLGIEFSATGDISSSAVSEARRKEKTARFYEQGVSRERIEQYRQNWLRYLCGILGDETPATKIEMSEISSPPQAMPQAFLLFSFPFALFATPGEGCSK